MRGTILVVDDEQDVLNLVATNLRRAGLMLITAMDGEQALHKARHDKPDMMVLDLMLPGLSGLEVCRTIKGDPNTAGMPILMLTARQEEIDHVVGLELGADDYVTKPFSPRVLVLHVQAVLRRSQGWRQKGETRRVSMTKPGIVKAGDITLDYDRCEIRVGGRSVEFSRTEFKLLSVLAERPGKVLSREQLLNQVWGYESETETRTIDMHVKRLREKLGGAADCLETVRGFGYRIIEPGHV